MDNLTLNIPESNTIQERLASVHEKIALAYKKSGRKPDSVRLVAVSKRQSPELIRAAYSAGLRSFGENYLEEAREKMEALADLKDIQWEMIGHVQSGKAKAVANSFHRVHSLDSEKLARLFDQARETGKGPLEVLVEVNVSGEESKSGLMALEPGSWPKILEIVQNVRALPRLRLTGLMCMPPLVTDMEANRPYFQKTRQLLSYINENLPGTNLTELSMGTSSDFPVAIEEGATIVRIGEALLGPRPTKKENN